MVEIEDAYRMQIASSLAYIDATYDELDEEEIDMAIAAIDMTATDIATEKYNKGETNVPKYKLSLQQWQSEDPTCYYLWDLYCQQEGMVKFGEFVKQPKENDYSVWISTEKTNDIRVTFKINKKGKWEVVVDKKDLQVYLTDFINKHYEDHINTSIESTVDDILYDALYDILF